LKEPDKKVVAQIFSTKRGRKKLSKDEKRRFQIKCSLTKSEMEKVNLGRPEGMSSGEWLRRKALDKKLPRAIPEINRQAWADLARVTGNLNQIAKRLNIRNENDFSIEPIKKEIINLRNKLIGLDFES
jgi:hypothetical protein